jgi:hypothetical protein
MWTGCGIGAGGPTTSATPTPEDSSPRTAVVVPFVEVERPPTTVTHVEVASTDSIEILTSVEAVAALRADNARLAAEREHYRERSSAH